MDKANQDPRPHAKPDLVEAKKLENQVSAAQVNQAAEKGLALPEPLSFPEEEYFYYDI
jgi:hypothetical protein